MTRDRYDDDRLVAVTLKNGRQGLVRLGDVHLAIDVHAVQIVQNLVDTSPLIRRLIQLDLPAPDAP